MHKLMATFMAGLLLLGTLTGCEKQKTYQDGTYTAAFAEFDSNGFKDYISITVQDGQVTAIEYDGLPEQDGAPLKSEDESFAAQMQAIQNNYPAQVQDTLRNQYLMVQDLDKIDVVAGATYSTECFKDLFKALEAQMYEGNTTHLVVENTPER